ncbi:OmpA family protein [Flavobacterium dankookense]|uniref:OOP family OmpA-OmpF porin n=1 Tax=Flavobacterium dankookense TaxID=706186 RepID=A0A4R6QFI5_9FLAO|nr:OmpA family protein [Flavobacterium dankookense]TDP61140.1 OOP family OmpA-OmpF porin [Flavobacterium dankookense]
MLIKCIYRTTMVVLPVLFSSGVFAQEKEGKPFNSWSIELNAGQNKAVRPFTSGYYSSDPTNYFNFSGVNHFDFGVRYMFNPRFGLKLDIASDEIKNQKSSGSLPFKSQQYRVGLQGVANLGSILNFESFTKRFGLLAHAGVQASQFTPKMGVNKYVTEDNGGIMVGLTPQFRIAKWLAITADFTAINNVRQHFNWDGTYSADANNLSGLMFNTNLGLTFYLGKKEKHADWYFESSVNSTDKEALDRIADLETMLQDTDRDGIPDYLDVQNNTPNGVIVDSKGRFMDVNNNGTPDELEKSTNGKDGINKTIVSQSDAIKSLMEKGYVNVFYDVNLDTPNVGSTNNVYQIINFLRHYPNAKAKLVGYADVRGNESKNKALSTRRAQKLYDIIIASGINSNRLSIEGQGVDSSFPKTTTGLDLARRVSIILE